MAAPGFRVPADPGLPVRLAGASPAAVAGARAGVSVAPPDAYDPERIRAALRGSQGVRTGAAAVREPGCSRGVRTGRIGPGHVEPGVPEGPAPGVPGRAGTRQSAGTPTRLRAGYRRQPDSDRRLGTGFQPDADAQPSTDTQPAHGPQPGTGWDGFQRDADQHWDRPGRRLVGQREPLREPAGRWAVRNRGHRAAGCGPCRCHPARSVLRRLAAGQRADLNPRSRVRVAGPSRGRACARRPDDWFTPREATDPEQTWPAADTEASSAATDTWFTPRERVEDGLARRTRSTTWRRRSARAGRW